MTGPDRPARPLTASLRRLLRPLFSPRAGFREFLTGNDRVALPLYSALLLYFALGLIMIGPLRSSFQVQFGEVEAAAGLSADTLERIAQSVASAVPFLGSLWVLLTVLAAAALLWLAAVAIRVPRPYGDWVGLASFSSLAGAPRVLLDTMAVAAGQPSGTHPLSLERLVDVPAGPAGEVLSMMLDPFQVWSLALIAVGFAVYTGRRLTVGAAVAGIVVLAQAVVAM